MRAHNTCINQHCRCRRRHAIQPSEPSTSAGRRRRRRRRRRCRCQGANQCGRFAIYAPHMRTQADHKIPEMLFSIIPRVCVARNRQSTGRQISIDVCVCVPAGAGANDRPPYPLVIIVSVPQFNCPTGAAGQSVRHTLQLRRQFFCIVARTPPKVTFRSAIGSVHCGIVLSSHNFACREQA